MPENFDNFAGASQLPAGLGGGDVNLSQSSITTLANSMSLSISGVLKQFLPMLVSMVSNAAGYIAGTNKYTQQQFISPMLGTNAFSAHQANQAYSMGVINKNAYLQNYAEMLGFKGLPAQMSSYMSQLPGGMERMQNGLDRAWSITQRETGLNPMFAMRQEREQKRVQVYNTAARGFINDANKIGLLDGHGKFENVRQVNEAIARYGDIFSDNNDNARWNKLTDDQKQQIRDMAKRSGYLEGIRDDGVDENGISYVDKAAEEQAEAASSRAKKRLNNELGALRKQRETKATDIRAYEHNGINDGSIEEARAKLEEIDRQIADKEAQLAIENAGGARQMEANRAAFIAMDPSSRMFKMATAADMAISNAMAFDVDEGQKAVAGGKMTLEEFNAKQSAQQFVVQAGGEDNARLLATEFSRVLTADSITSGSAAKTIEAGMKALGGGDVTDKQLQSKKDELMALLGSDKASDRVLGVQKFMAFSRAAGNEDATGLAGMMDLYGNATALAGGDQKAAQDMVSMAMAMNGVTDITKMSQQDTDSANRLVSLGAMLGGPEAMAATMDKVTSSLESLGIATRDVTGKQTRLAGVLAKSSIEMQAGLVKNGGLGKEDAAIVADEAMQDLVGSRSGESMAALLELGNAAKIDKGTLGKISENLAGKTTEEQLAWLQENGYDNIVNAWNNSTDEERKRYAARGVQFETAQAQELHRRAAGRELLTSEPLDSSAALQLEHAEFNQDTFDKEWFKKSWGALGYDVNNLDAYDEQTQDMIRRSSGFSKEDLGAFFQRSVGHFAGGGNLAISEMDSGEDVVDKMNKVYDGTLTPVEVPDGKTDGTAALSGEKGNTNVFAKDRQQNAEEVNVAITQFKESITKAEGFFDKVSAVGDTAIDKLGGAAVAAAKGLEALIEVLKGLGVVQ